MERINCPFEYKFASDAAPGSFEGYAATFGGIDDGGDCIEPGSFKTVLATGRRPKMLLQHAGMPFIPSPVDLVPVGKWDALAEDSNGLHVKGRLINLDTDLGKRLHGTMKEEELSDLSIGYLVGDFVKGTKAGEPRRTIKSFKALPEISLVTFPMDPRANITSVKSADRITTIREFEDFLRDVGGYSHASAKAIAAGGFKAKPDPRDEDGIGEAIAGPFQRLAELIRK